MHVPVIQLLSGPASDPIDTYRPAAGGIPLFPTPPRSLSRRSGTGGRPWEPTPTRTRNGSVGDRALGRLEREERNVGTRRYDVDPPLGERGGVGPVGPCAAKVGEIKSPRIYFSGFRNTSYRSYSS